MPKAKFEIDPTQLDKSAEAAFRAHQEKRLSYADWKATATQIERLRGIESFRRAHNAALHDRAHHEHDRRTVELQTLYENAYPDGPAGAL